MMLINPYVFGSSGAAMTWDSAQKSTFIALSGGDLTAGNSNVNSTWKGVRATSPLTGKSYFEIIVNATNANNGRMIGLANSSQVFLFSADEFPGEVANSVGFIGSDGKIYVNSSVVGTASSYTIGDVIGVAYDATTGEVWFSKNGTFVLSGNPAAGTNPVATLSGTLYPSVAFFTDTGNVTARFRAADLTYSPPSGFSAPGT